MKGVPASSGGRAATPSGPSPQAVSGIAGIPNAGAVPLTEQLERVPADARLEVQTGEFSHSFFPVGRMCHEAVAEITRLRIELSRATGLQRVSIVDQDNKEIGHCHRLMRELTVMEAFVDEQGTAWTPPTAWAYFAACRARDAARDRDGSPEGTETGTGSAEGNSPGLEEASPKPHREEGQ